MERKWNRVLISPKVDLDTCGCAFLMGVTRDDKAEVVRSGQASETDLADLSVLCIEVGGSGREAEGNFDHHEEGGPEESAILQGWNWFQEVLELDGLVSLLRERFGLVRGEEDDDRRLFNISVLVEYTNTLDVKGPRGLGKEPRAEEFPYLSDVFAGMLLTERNPVEQLHKGIEILDYVIRSSQNPTKTIQGFDAYAEAKAENNRQVAKAMESAQWTTTQAGRQVGYLETDFFGAPGVLFGAGAEIAVAFSPQFGNPPVPKFTVAGNGGRVDAALPALNALEQGWGGPATGTIIGSPRSGSRLTLEQVVEIVRQVL